MYVGRRKDLYAQMFRIFHESRRSPIKPANLWVLLYMLRSAKHGRAT